MNVGPAAYHPDQKGLIDMTDIDYCQGWYFIDPADGKRRKMRFRQTVDGIGQLVAVVAKAYDRENGDEIAITRPEVQISEVEAAINGFENWASHYVSPIKRSVDLALIRDRIRAAGLT
ncbi:hypothetical protein MYCOZU1_05836 (plasmid) [Mycobacterium intracellulare subsp. chimaera]|uniref:Uncharacterized protein n=5 Tax=Mycobacteriaceae TaxID=1762 RepID=D5P5F7_9MYCO|nr:hypothetical protein MKAN_29770 [Mycobacterium kansasii ATCC 12478]ASL12426.1 hypothetical protein MYCODSM44623_05753 [Mycobacterium intracellulare subsp. chimaera]AXO25864.1 hypothetical protein DFS55_24785 [Mycobacterium avium subsp. hominissuis]EFG78693.1 hypothetical protein HMPREF0591_1401 [Mycobacterium parascrofulaceum ATCC BAA-614]ORW21894.1 hypothetical protein AWC17_05975 [Mycobacterium nebraskense]